jgi:membrane-bound lytic murein transglycosylase D
MQRFYLLTALLLAMLSWPFSPGTSHAGKGGGNDFPLYPIITNNVRFWEQIYGVYSLRQAVIHDAEDLSKIYQVITLADPDDPGARQHNTAQQKAVCENYRTILSKLAEQPPSNPEEQRIAAMFPGKDGRQRIARAAENVRSQSGQKERFLAGVIKSQEYLTEIKQILRSYNLPEELAHLPHVESSFNTHAYSKVGAAGLWQFTRETGKEYLSITPNVDLRLDPIAATHAAAKYLTKSYQALNNWPLALTSYNYGLGGMLRAVAEEGNYERIFANYNKGHFKFASRNFYAEFLAARNVALHHEKNMRIEALPPRHRYLTLTGNVFIKEIGRRFSLPLETIADLNPALRPPVLKGERPVPAGYALRLPATSTGREVIVRPSPVVTPSKGPSSLIHVVQRGDTAHNIASRHQIPVQRLIEANNLDAQGTIRLGQSLHIPEKSEIPDSRKKPGSNRITSDKKHLSAA